MGITYYANLDNNTVEVAKDSGAVNMQMSTDRTWGGPFDPTLEQDEDGNLHSSTNDNILAGSSGGAPDQGTD